LKSYSITENKVDKIGTQFNEKKREYNLLFDKKVPESINFGEKQDTPLSNMDDLIKQHLKEREEELKKYAPPPLVTQLDNTINNKSILPSQTNKLKIDTNSNINIQIEEIKEKEDVKIKKSVSWSDNNKELIEKQQLEIELLKKQVFELFEKIKLIQDKNNG
jgi:hypothetical protein